MKFMKKVFIAALFLLCFWQCSKDDADGDLSGNEYIRGRLFLFDNLTQQANGTPLGKRKVLLSYAASGDTSNYLLSTTTDDDGYFVFQNLKKDESYRLYYEETVSGVFYQAIGVAKAPIDTLQLSAFVSTSRQNGIHFTITDDMGAAINGASVCVFNSTLAAGFVSNGCDGNTFKLTSNSFGHASKFSISPGTYYINSSIEIGGVPWTSKDTITVTNNIAFDTIKLKRPNGIHFTVTDEMGAAINGANLCIFNSPLAAGFISNGCDGNTFKLTSNSSGQAFKFSILPGTYYVNSSFDIGGVPWMSKDTITVTNNVVFDTIKLKLPNGIRFTVLDSLGTAVNGANICVFTSLALYQRDTCEGNNFQLVSSLTGEAAKYNLVYGTYYVFSTLKTGDFIWAARDTLELTNQVLESTLVLRKKL